MYVLEAIIEALRARRAGDELSFEHDGQPFTMRARCDDRFELALPAPELAELALRVEFGPATAAAEHRPAVDPYWRVRASDLERAAILFNEPPWPIGLIPLAGLKVFPPPPRYHLRVDAGVATITRRATELTPAAAIGAARLLLQLVTRPARWEAELAALSSRARKRNGPYR